MAPALEKRGLWVDCSGDMASSVPIAALLAELKKHCRPKEADLKSLSEVRDVGALSKRIKLQFGTEVLATQFCWSFRDLRKDRDILLKGR